MERRFLKTFLSFSILILAFSLPALAGSKSGNPTDMIRGVVEETFKALNAYPVAGPEENLPKRRESIKNIIDTNFDSLEMSRRALGKNWQDQSKEKQLEFIKLFYWRLYSFYILKVETYSDEKVQYVKEKASGNKAAVLTRINSKRYPEFDIEYRLKKDGDIWKIYDVVIEGVSLVANYRSQFDSFLAKKTFDELLQGLREKAPESAR